MNINLSNFERGMLAYLITGSSQLNALVSNRISPIPLPQTPTFPFITYQKIPTGNHLFYHGGHTGFVLGRYQFNCWSTSKRASRNVADELITTISSWTGTASFVLDDFDGYEPDTQLFRTIVDTHLVSMNT